MGKKNCNKLEKEKDWRNRKQLKHQFRKEMLGPVIVCWQ